MREEWFCITCVQDAPFHTRRGILAHLAGDHGITDARGPRTLTVHLDTAREWISSYEWTIGDVKILQQITGPRGASVQR